MGFDMGFLVMGFLGKEHLFREVEEITTSAGGTFAGAHAQGQCRHRQHQEKGGRSLHELV